MHPPPQVDVQHLDQLLPPFGVVLATDAVEQLWDTDIRPHDRIQHPFDAQVGDAFETFGERVPSADGDGPCWAEPFAGEEAEEGGFAGAVGADEEGAGRCGEGEGERC